MEEIQMADRQNVPEENDLEIVDLDNQKDSDSVQEQKDSESIQEQKEIEEYEKRKKRGTRNRIIAIAAVILAVALLIALAVFLILRLRRNSSSQEEMRGGMGDFMENGMIVASGTSSYGMDIQTFDVDELDTELEIEEVYLGNGDEVEAGQKILKVTDESLEKARKELTQELKSAEYAYRLGVISYQSSVISAQNTYDTSLIGAEYAQSDYDASLYESAARVADLELQVQEQQELVNEYELAGTANYYYTEYKVEELKQKAYEDFELLNKLYTDWNIADQKASGQNTQASNGTTGTAATGTTSTGTTSSTSGSTTSTSGLTTKIANTQLAVYNAFDSILKNETSAYEKALENAEDDTTYAAANLSLAQAKLESLQAQLDKEKAKYEQAQAAAKTEMDSAVTAGQLAQNVYDTAVDKAQDELDTLEDTLKDAQDNLEDFEAAIGDGYMYCDTTGTIMMVAVREDSTLTADSPVIAYMDTETASVTASVSQDYISEVAIGMSASAIFESAGTYSGTVVSVNPQTQSSSRSSVSYSVTISLEGDVSGLGQNLSCTVYLGDSSMLPQGDGRGPGSGERPEGMEEPGNGERPEGMEGAENGERPEGAKMPDSENESGNHSDAEDPARKKDGEDSGSFVGMEKIPEDDPLAGGNRNASE